MTSSSIQSLIRVCVLAASMTMIVTRAWGGGESPSRPVENLQPVAVSPRVEGVPAARLQRLERGVNLSHWFWLPTHASDGDSGANAVEAVTRADAELLKAAGVTHVRLPIEPSRIWDVTTGEFKKGRFERVMSAVSMLTEAGLAVIFDAHVNESPWVALDEESGRFKDLERFWRATASALSSTDPEMVFVELLNEPTGIKPEQWARAQVKLIDVVRAALPAHTIIATGADWGGVDGLMALTPVPDRNVVYSFHFYEPHTFTHQGATWGWKNWKHIKGVPWPMDEAARDRIAATVEDADARGEIGWFFKEKWDAEKVRARIAKAAEWSKTHGVPIYCGEFGVHKPYAPRESRLAWLRDVTGALREHGIGWAMWDYAGGFALVERSERTGDAARALDAGVAEALGL